MSLKSIYNRIVLHRWEIGLVGDSIEGLIRGDALFVKKIQFPFNSRWFADPFILDYNDEEIILLVEDYSDSDKKGKISKLVIDRKSMKLKDVKIILELDTHLSFPAIIRKDGRVFIYPENSEAKTLNLYEYDLKTDQCVIVRQLSNKSMADAIITDYFGEKLLFSTMNNGNVLDVYKYDEIKATFVCHSNVRFKENIARNGGDYFEVNGNLYRAAQECNYTYGHAISLQKIEEKDGVFQMKEVRRILPPKGAFGIHTFNTYKGLTVVDLKVFRHPWIAVPLFKLRNLFKNAR